MSTISVKFEPGLVSKDPPRPGMSSNIYAKTIDHLIRRTKPGGPVVDPGSIQLVYLKFKENYRVFGAFTLNTSGNISFFPDFLNLESFDHITIKKNFLEGGHLTKITPSGKHKQPYQIATDHITEGIFHVATFGFIDDRFIRDLPNEIHLPMINISEEQSKECMDILHSSLVSQHGILSFLETEGIFCVQMLITPKDIAWESIPTYLPPLTQFISDIQDLDKPVPALKLAIPVQNDCPFSIYLVAFCTKGKLKSGEGFMTFKQKT